MASLVLYGSDVADATLTNACDMALTTTGGTETSKTTTMTASAGGVYGEILSQSGTSTGVSSIPATPSGKGWVYNPGAGTFATGNWSAVVTISSAAWGGSSSNTDITVRFFKYSGGSYTSIGNLAAVGITSTSKTTYTFTAVSMSSVTFAANDLVYVDLWWHDNNSTVNTDNPVIYESTSSSTGVANDMQVTTSSFTASGGTTVNKDLSTRFRLGKALDLVTRFRLGKALNLSSRFRLGKALDLSSRFRLGKALNLSSRFRLGKALDLSSRFRLQKALDLSTRFRLAVNKLIDLSTRFRLGKALDLSTRFNLSAPVVAQTPIIYPPATLVWTVIGGFDQTLLIPNDGIKFSGAVGDQQAKATIDIYDTGNVLSFNIGDEVILWNAVAPPEGLFGGGTIASPPSHNMLLTGAFSSGWTAINALAGNFTLTDGGTTTTLTFSNSTGQGLQVQECPRGYTHVGQSYMLSVYATIATPLVNANAQVMLQFLDAGGNALATNVLTFSTTTGNAQQRVTISAVAPADSVYAQALLGGQTTVNGSNSGNVVYGAPQIEPMWFATTQGMFYPTPDINNAQADCATMPDNTVSRMCRYFSGAIDTWKIVEYDGPNRTYELSVAGSGHVLEDGNINASYEAQYDDQILSNIVSTYFSGILSVAAPNSSSALPVIRAALIDAISYNDNSLREVCNGLTSESNSIFYVDPYYTLRYNPSYYSAVSFSLTDQTADNITTFNYYEYYPEQDGTQMAQDVKVTGGKFLAPAITDTFSGNGSTKVFTLSQQPYNVNSVLIGAATQKTFIKGTGPTLGVGGYVAVIDKTLMTLTFNTAPTTGTNNVTCTYTYEAPVSVEVKAQQALTPPNAPAYVNRQFSAKVNDTNLLTIAAAIQRGLAEITQSAQPLSILDLKCSQYIPAGYIVFFTSTPDNIINQPYVCQQVDFVYLGNGLAEWHYTLGAWRPHLLDHIRNANKAVNRSKTTTNINLPQQTDLVFNEKVLYSESITFTLTAPNTSTYGTGIYGTHTYN